MNETQKNAIQPVIQGAVKFFSLIKPWQRLGRDLFHNAETNVSNFHHYILFIYGSLGLNNFLNCITVTHISISGNRFKFLSQLSANCLWLKLSCNREHVRHCFKNALHAKICFENDLSWIFKGHICTILYWYLNKESFLEAFIKAVSKTAHYFSPPLLRLRGLFTHFKTPVC